MAVKDELLATAAKVGQLETDFAAVVAENVQLKVVNGELEAALAECLGDPVPDPDPDPIPDPDPDPDPVPDPQPQPGPIPTPDTTFNSANPYTAAKVNALAAGSVFLFQGPMTLPKATVPTKANNRYFAQGGVVLDGQNSTALAFADSKTTGWEVDGFEIKGYTGLNGEGVANKEGSAAIILRTGCILRNSKVHDNKYSGVRFEGTNSHVYDSELYNNHAEGFCGTSKGGGSIERSEIHHNGDAVGTSGLGNNRGGCKMVHTTGFLMADNHVHHNDWNGLWLDINNIGAKYLRNVIEFNKGSGIFHEVSFGCEIAHNTLRDNGINRKINSADTYPTKTQIEVSNSPDVWVHDNELFISAGSLGYFGISVLNSDHDQWRLGKMSSGRCLGVRNLIVEKNKITLSGPEWIGVFAMLGNIPSNRSGDQNCGQKTITDPASKNIWRQNTVTKSGGAYANVPYILSGAHVSEAAWSDKGYT